jgi:hypothetical protein
VIQQKVKTWAATQAVPAVARLTGLLELLLWLSVVTAAVSIPNFDTH